MNSFTRKAFVKKALELAGTLEGAARLVGVSRPELIKLVVRHKIVWPPPGKDKTHGAT